MGMFVIKTFKFSFLIFKIKLCLLQLLKIVFYFSVMPRSHCGDVSGEYARSCNSSFEDCRLKDEEQTTIFAAGKPCIVAPEEYATRPRRYSSLLSANEKRMSQ